MEAQWAHIYTRIQWVADFDGRDKLDNLTDDLFSDILLHIEPFERPKRLPTIRKTRLHNLLNRMINIRRFVNIRCILRPEEQVTVNEPLPCDLFENMLPGGVTSCEGHLPDLPEFYDLRGLCRVEVQVAQEVG